MELVYNNSFFRNFIQKFLDSQDRDKGIAKKVAEAMLSNSSAEGLYFLQEQYGQLAIQFLFFTPNLASGIFKNHQKLVQAQACFFYLLCVSFFSLLALIPQLLD